MHISLFFVSIFIVNMVLKAQDSGICSRLKYNADTLEQKASGFIKSSKDSVVHFLEDETNMPGSTKLHTEYFAYAGEIKKIHSVEQYKQWTIIQTVYYSLSKPFKYSRQEYYNQEIKNDFDIYYGNDEVICQTERNGIGKPYPPAFLNFSYQLLRSK